MNPDDLKHLIDRELKQLPVPRAPETLLPRVLAATAGRQPAPSHAPWLVQPWHWRPALVAVLALIAAGVAVLGYLAWPHVNTVSSWLGTAFGTLTRAAAIAEDGATLVRAFCHVLLLPVTFTLLVVGLSLSLACAALWTVLDRVTLGGAPEP